MLINQTPHSSQDLSEEAEALEDYKEEEEKKGILNVGGVLSGTQVVLVSVLIALSVCLVWTQTGSLRQHEKQLGMYFNLNLLGLDNNGLYQDSDNQDEMYNQFFSLEEMQSLLRNMVNVTNLYAEDGVVLFSLENDKPIIKIEPVYLNDTIGLLEFYSVDEAMNYFQNFDTNATRQFLLQLQKLLLTARLGDSKFANNYQIMGKFIVHHSLMLDCQISYEYENINSHILKRLSGMRVLSQLVAGTLLLIFVYRAVSIRRNINDSIRRGEQSQESLRGVLGRYMKWYIFLAGCNLVLMVSSIYAPLCAFLQLLPLFEYPEQADQGQMYNFNKNIRYSLPLILRIWLPLLLCLNGFVYFSMLIYANSDAAYFGDYFLALFDYMYQMFQVGTYQIFTEMQNYGYAADVLYCFLYFYVFMMGTTLIPAFFVTLIQLKLNERDVKQFSADLLKQAVCPHCNNRDNGHENQRAFNIIVTSPKLSPLVKEKRLIHSPKSVLNSLKSKDSRDKNSRESGEGKKRPELISLFIGHEDNMNQLREKYKMSGKFVRYARKCAQLLREIERLMVNEKDAKELERALQAIRSYRFVVGGWSGKK